MSQAFVKEHDEQWLHEIPPTMPALQLYLSRQNNGVPVYQKKMNVDTKGREIYLMSNGLEYAIDTTGRWEIVW